MLRPKRRSKLRFESTLRKSQLIISGRNRSPQALGGLLLSAVRLDSHSVFTFRLTMPIPIFAKKDRDLARGQLKLFDPPFFLVLLGFEHH